MSKIDRLQLPKNETVLEMPVLLKYDDRDDITIARLKEAPWVCAHGNGMNGQGALQALKENLLFVLENPEKWESPSSRRKRKLPKKGSKK